MAVERLKATSPAFAAGWAALGHDIVRRDLFADPPPHLPSHVLHWAPSLRPADISVDPVHDRYQEELVGELLAADVVLVGAPMYNWSVPSTLKATSSAKKILLKRLAAKVLPPEFDRQRKQGFSIPLAEWLKRGPFRELFWSVLTDQDCLFDSKAVAGLLKGQDAGRTNGERLFALVQFELWRRHYGVSYC